MTIKEHINKIQLAASYLEWQSGGYQLRADVRGVIDVCKEFLDYLEALGHKDYYDAWTCPDCGAEFAQIPVGSTFYFVHNEGCPTGTK